LKILNEPDPLVRDNAADALGTAMKLVGEKAMSPFLADLDNLKMTKVSKINFNNCALCVTVFLI
jgi:cytoskeleton-associated protein 5